jgi:CubicO group peptidase (beta-lactamase class C family)
MKRSVNIKYFLLIIFFVFNSFSVSTSIVDRDMLDKNIKIDKFSKEGLAYYPEEFTKDVAQKLDSVFTRFNKRYDFHGSVIIAKKGKVLFKNNYGYADFKKKTLIDENSVFQLASVSKQFTAASILILQEKGQLSVDDKVTKFYPEFPYTDVTIRHLLNHTSGLPKYFWLAEHKWNKDYPPSNQEMMEMISTHNVERFFSPGASFDYSNTGYMVLASIVEKVSGTEFGDFVATNIFEPLDMKNTFVYRYEQDSMTENQLAGYRLYKRRWHAKIGGTVNDKIVGDKNVYSNPEDMLKWVQGLNSGKIISESTLSQMYTQGETKYNRKVPYGFGFRIKEDESDKIIYHNGKWNGFTTSLMQYPNDELVVITLEHSNYNSMKDLNQIVKRIVDDNFSGTLN